MNARTRKWLLWCSLIILPTSTGGMIFAALNSSKMGDTLAISFLILLIWSILNLLYLLSNKFQDRTGFRKNVKIVTYLFPLTILFLFVYDLGWIKVNFNPFYDIVITLIICLIPFVLIHVFIIQKTEVSWGLIAIILYATIGLILKRFTLLDSDPHLVFSFIMIGSGMYMFGLKCVSIIEKNRFLIVIAMLSGLLIFLGGFTMMFLSSTQENLSLVIYSIAMFLMTLIVVLSLPVSGYVKWPVLHKNIFKKIMIPWVFFLLMISIRFVFPEMNKMFFSEKRNQYLEFRMNDYKIINKNGLLPE